MIFNDVRGGLLAGGVGGIASGFLGITSGGILVPLLRSWRIKRGAEVHDPAIHLLRHARA
jgi:hypothetical protein